MRLAFLMNDIVYTPLYRSEGKDYQPTDPKTPSISELLLSYGELIIRSADEELDDTQENLYTVPEGYTLYLVAAGGSMTSRENANQGVFGFMAITTATIGTVNYDKCLIRFQCRGYSTEPMMNTQVAHDYSFPIKVLNGEKVVLYNAQSDTTVSGYIVGYLLNNNIKNY